MNYNVTLCTVCGRPMSFRQLREAVYWLPDMTEYEWRWAIWDGIEHKFAHRYCWKRMKEKRRRAIREFSFRGQGPRSMDQFV